MRKILLAGCLVLLLGIGMKVVGANAFVDVTSSLSGKVTWTVPSGTPVEEGSEIVRISSLTGEVAAARAPEAGTVREVLVKPGDQISTGNVVAHIVKK